ncbi:TIGR04282 family arsenosugar biosynthesis glycosyltransferase [Methylomonas methanica]|uniref:Glycosyltransferase n=1 Tax=Methylomonas methanica (strain DSM 25384 / MC09) TaxID=857087 RepID=F9ZVF2_METMM|nr:TIGR04282 family arsenosugar biosynthesis glycosyltransferase [Methylomonas methanica]AEG01934.1 Protein of unknown function DUF2064 [Methylomonas methanica MC09]
MDYQFPDSVLIVFCKAPIPGQVKTRLQPALSAEQAAEVHEQLTLLTLERAFRQNLCPVQLCCAPDSRHPFFQTCAERFPVGLAEQRGNELGSRMHNAFCDAFGRYRHAVLMGCDCPSLTGDDLRQAFTALRDGKDAVLAPTEDGGYVLIGLNAPQPTLFANMRWGHEQVMAETRRRLRDTQLVWQELVQQWDVDTIADWRRYLSQK